MDLVNDKHSKLYALKRIICTTEEQEKDAIHEIKTLQTLQEHENILPFLGFFFYQNLNYLHY